MENNYEYVQEAQEKKGSVITGFIGALLGAAIGVFSKDQMSATSLTVPVMLVFSFLPMLSMFNETIGKVAKFFYAYCLSFHL